MPLITIVTLIGNQSMPFLLRSFLSLLSNGFGAITGQFLAGT
jgi:hypothetical protein